MDPLRQAWLVMVAAGLLFYVDAPLRTLGQRFVVHRWRERLLLFTLELDLVMLWAFARFFLGWEARFLPTGSERPVVIAGLAVTLAGVALAVWARLALGNWFSASFGIKPGHELVTRGPYAVTRHPIYTGLLVGMLGTALVWNSVSLGVLAWAMAVPLYFHTLVEEMIFEQHFGEAWRAYRRRVPRLLPAWRRGRQD